MPTPTHRRDLTGIKKYHHRRDILGEQDRCRCGQTMPCDVLVVLGKVEALEIELSQVKALLEVAVVA